MDDAGGRRRGPRPALTAAIRSSIEHAYGISLATARDLGGSGNRNLLADGPGGPVVVRIYRTNASAGRVAAIQAARGRLAAHGVPTAAPVPTRTGDLLVQVGPNVVEVERFVPSDAAMDSFERVKTGLPVLARLHDVLVDGDPGPDADGHRFTNYLPPADVVDRTRLGVTRIRAWGPTAVESAMADAAERLADAAGQADQPFNDLPVQLVHGDFWDNNVLSRDDELVLVADLDFMGYRRRVDDLALTLYFASYPCPQPVGPCARRVLAEFLDAYDRGANRPLSPAERAAVPVAIARQPLWSVGVWVAELDDKHTARRHLAGHLPACAKASPSWTTSTGGSRPSRPLQRLPRDMCGRTSSSRRAAARRGRPCRPRTEPTTATAWAIVPCPQNASILATSNRGGSLPSVAFASHRVPTDMSIAEALRASLGIETRLIRQLDVVGTFGPDVVVLMDAIPAAAAPAGTRWVNRRDASRLDRLAKVVEAWYCEQAGAPPPQRRVPWYRPGWFDETTRWVDDVLAASGHRRAGSLEPVTHTPYSAVSRLASSMGDLFLKASRPGEEHTVRLARLLSERVPGRVPHTVATEPARGWGLSAAVPVQPVVDGTRLVDEALAVLAEVQMASAAWVPELTVLGCPDLSLEVLAGDAWPVITSDAVMAALDPDDRPRLTQAAARVPAWCETAAAAGLPVCLQHGDFGPHNVLPTPRGPVLLDWRGWIGHPFADAHLLLQNVSDPARLASAWDAYLRPWSAGVAPARLDEAVSAMRPVFSAQYLVQVGRVAMAVAREPASYERWTGRQLSHNVRWFAGQLIRAPNPPS